eukprot:752506-Hanusia_phi.AAC.3
MCKKIQWMICARDEALIRAHAVLAAGLLSQPLANGFQQVSHAGKLAQSDAFERAHGTYEVCLRSRGRSSGKQGRSPDCAAHSPFCSRESKAGEVTLLAYLGHALAKQPRSPPLQFASSDVQGSKLTDAAYMQKLAQGRNFRMKNGYFDSSSYAQSLTNQEKTEQNAYMKNWHKKNRIAAKSAVKDAAALYKKWMLIDPYTGRSIEMSVELWRIDPPSRSKTNMVVPQENVDAQHQITAFYNLRSGSKARDEKATALGGYGRQQREIQCKYA